MTSRDWDLWTWWATAHALPVIPARWDHLHQFLTDVPCAPSTVTRRISAIRAAHLAEHARIIGLAPPPFPPAVGPPLGQVLHTIPVYGHPHGVRGRRDGLIVLAASLGYPTIGIQALTPADVVTFPVPAIGGRVLDRARHGLACPACALTRWLRALSAWRAELVDAHWRALELLVEDQPVDAAAHDCIWLVDQGWQQAAALVPPIDRHGCPDLRGPVSTRAITAILREHRQHTTTVVGPPPPTGTPSDSHIRPVTPASTPQQRQDQLDAIEAALDRLDTLLATMEHTQTTLATGPR